MLVPVTVRLHLTSGDLVFCTSQVYKARRVAAMKMVDDGFEEKAKARREQNMKTLAEKGLLKKRSKKRKKGRADE